MRKAGFTERDQRDFAAHKQEMRGALERMAGAAVEAVRLGQRLADVQRRGLFKIDGGTSLYRWVHETYGIERSQAKKYLALGRALYPQQVAGRNLTVEAMYEIAEATRAEVREVLLESGVGRPKALRAGRVDAEAAQARGEVVEVVLEAARVGIARGAPLGQESDPQAKASAALQRLVDGVKEEGLLALRAELERALDQVRQRCEALLPTVAVPVLPEPIVEVMPEGAYEEVAERASQLAIPEPPPAPPQEAKRLDLDRALAVWLGHVRRAGEAGLQAACVLPLLLLLGLPQATAAAAPPEGLIEGDHQGPAPRSADEAAALRGYFRYQELVDEERPREAIPILERTVVLAEDAFPPRHPFPGELRCLLGRLYLGADDAPRALAELDMGLARYAAGIELVVAAPELLEEERRQVKRYRDDRARALERLGVVA